VLPSGDSAVIISGLPDRSIWFDTTRVTLQDLRARVAALVRTDANRKILIKGDDSLRVKDVRAVMAEAKAAGAKGPVEAGGYVKALQSRLQPRAAADRIVFVTPEEEAQYTKLVEALDGAREAGAETLGMLTEPTEQHSSAAPEAY
jgi:biopolymer transport protein ExbD